MVPPATRAVVPIRAENGSHEAAGDLRVGGASVSHQPQLYQPGGRIGHSYPIAIERLSVRSRVVFQDASR
jgi:hypothetical protein